MAKDGSTLYEVQLSCGQLAVALLIETRSPGPRSGRTPSEVRRIGQTCRPAAPAKLTMANCQIVRTAQGLTLHMLEGVRACPYNCYLEF